MSIFVNVSTFWDFFGFHGPEKGLNDMMHEIYRSQKHPMLPTNLNGKLEKQGYKGKFLNEEFDGFNLNINLNISKKSKVINSLEKILKKLKKNNKRNSDE